MLPFYSRNIFLSTLGIFSFVRVTRYATNILYIWSMLPFKTAIESENAVIYAMTTLSAKVSLTCLSKAESTRVVQSSTRGIVTSLHGATFDLASTILTRYFPFDALF